VPYSGDTDAVIAQAAWFMLRGFGVKDAIIAAHPIPKDPPHWSAGKQASNATENDVG
jgi:hypothetical protein